MNRGSVAVELAAEVGATVEESALFTEVNRPLILERFRGGIARSDVVAELLELSEAAQKILAP